MLDDGGLRIMELAGKGYCCTQIMVRLALDELDRENADLVRAASGLCLGLGDCAGPCGVLTGGALVIGLYAGKGLDAEERAETMPVMLESFRDWFAEATQPFGGTSCGAILEGKCGKPHNERCGNLMSTANARLREILVENGLDPAEGRDAE